MFFATPAETETWLAGVVESMHLNRFDEELPGGFRRSFVWSRDRERLTGIVKGVQVILPRIHDQTLTAGETGWMASAFEEPVASDGRRLSERLSRSLRRFAPVPLYAVSNRGDRDGGKPVAWGTVRAADGSLTLRQFRDGAATFVP